MHVKTQNSSETRLYPKYWFKSMLIKLIENNGVKWRRLFTRGVCASSFRPTIYRSHSKIWFDSIHFCFSFFVPISQHPFLPIFWSAVMRSEIITASFRTQLWDKSTLHPVFNYTPLLRRYFIPSNRMIAALDFQRLSASGKVVLFITPRM